MPKIEPKYEDLDLAALLAMAEYIAEKRHDGHLTMLRFTTHWKCMFGTPNLDTGARDEVHALQGAPTLRDALINLLRGYKAR